MSIQTSVIVEGTVARVATREVTVKATGIKMVFTTMLVIGPDCLANVRVNTDTHDVAKEGAKIRARCDVSSYRDDDEISLSAWLG